MAERKQDASPGSALALEELQLQLNQRPEDVDLLLAVGTLLSRRARALQQELHEWERRRHGGETGVDALPSNFSAQQVVSQIAALDMQVANELLSRAAKLDPQKTAQQAPSTCTWRNPPDPSLSYRSTAASSSSSASRNEEEDSSEEEEEEEMDEAEQERHMFGLAQRQYESMLAQSPTQQQRGPRTAEQEHLMLRLRYARMLLNKVTEERRTRERQEQEGQDPTESMQYLQRAETLLNEAAACGPLLEAFPSLERDREALSHQLYTLKHNKRPKSG
ncbi:hypothetical protein QOT17_022956 [Balamuthia mandrillaris]